MANISTVTLPDGVTYNLKDGRVDNLKTDEIFITNIAIEYDENTDAYFVASSDKTAREIYTAYSAGKMCIANVTHPDYGDTPTIAYLNFASLSSGYYEASFVEPYRLYTVYLSVDPSDVSHGEWASYANGVSNYNLSLSMIGNTIYLKAGILRVSYIDLPVYNGGVSSS